LGKKNIIFALSMFAVFLNDLEQFMEDKNITGLESISSELEAQLEIYLKIFALLYNT
jgi:hypothetical protein